MAKLGEPEIRKYLENRVPTAMIIKDGEGDGPDIKLVNFRDMLDEVQRFYLKGWEEGFDRGFLNKNQGSGSYDKGFEEGKAKANELNWVARGDF